MFVWPVFRDWHIEDKNSRSKGLDIQGMHDLLDEAGADLKETRPKDGNFEDDGPEDFGNERITAHEEHMKDTAASIRSLDVAHSSAASFDD